MGFTLKIELTKSGVVIVVVAVTTFPTKTPEKPKTILIARVSDLALSSNANVRHNSEYSNLRGFYGFVWFVWFGFVGAIRLSEMAAGVFCHKQNKSHSGNE